MLRMSLDLQPGSQQFSSLLGGTACDVPRKCPRLAALLLIFGSIGASPKRDSAYNYCLIQRRFRLRLGIRRRSAWRHKDMRGKDGTNVGTYAPHEGSADTSRESTGGGEGPYFLLNDQPAGHSAGDLLGMTEIAEGIASVLLASMSSSPFVLAVDAGWGMGKSTLLRQIEYRLSDRPGIVKLRFNAWTAQDENALEGLIKAVLAELDPNILRRWARRLARQRSALLITRLAFSLAARFFGVSRLVDELWERMAIDAKSRNELRGLIQDMLSDWISHDGKRDPDRALVVFIDDLDRCSDDVVVKVCEAVKLYLDAPGLIFVMACDQSILARGLSLSARGGAPEGRTYLEKIVQVAYRMPPPDKDQITKLISVYARESGTTKLFDEAVTGILADGTGRNPRRIKRIINSFVLEYRLDPAWRKPPLDSALLVTAILLQHLYTAFYELLVNEESNRNFIGDFMDYVQVRERMSEPPLDGNDPYWKTVRRICKAYRVQLPEKSPVQAEKLTEVLQLLEHALPEDFSALGHNSAFIALLRRIEDAEASQTLRAQLRRRPLATASDPVVPEWKADLYFCPEHDYQWLRSTLGQPIPKCPTHDIQLVRGTRIKRPVVPPAATNTS
jgi:KAP family P-loop domain